MFEGERHKTTKLIITTEGLNCKELLQNIEENLRDRQREVISAA